METIKQKTMGIYGIEDIKTGSIYIGQSADIAKRWSNHAAFLKNNEHNYIELQKAYNLDCNRIKYTILEECKENELTSSEDFWIKHVQRVDGWTLINKQKFGGRHNTKVKDTTKMKAAQKWENNGNCCKLSVEDVIEIKKYLAKGVSQKELARQYNISKTHVNNIANNKRWKNVKEEERKMEDREIAIVNRGKTAYLYCNSKFEDRVEKIVRNGQEMWAFVYVLDREIQKLLDEYDSNTELKKYNASFKHVACTLAKHKYKSK